MVVPYLLVASAEAFVVVAPAFVDPPGFVPPMKRAGKCAIPTLASPPDWPWQYPFPKRINAPQYVPCVTALEKQSEVHPSRPHHPLGRGPPEREVVDREQIRRRCFQNQGPDTFCDRIL